MSYQDRMEEIIPVDWTQTLETRIQHKSTIKFFFWNVLSIRIPLQISEPGTFVFFGSLEHASIKTVIEEIMFITLRKIELETQKKSDTRTLWYLQPIKIHLH